MKLLFFDRSGRIVTSASVVQNGPHHQFLFIILNYLVSTSVKWTPCFVVKGALGTDFAVKRSG